MTKAWVVLAAHLMLLASSYGQYEDNTFRFIPYDVATYLRGGLLNGEVAERHQIQLSSEVKFPCSLDRSPVPPTRVDQLRPGDVSVVAALGDSLIAGNGATERNAIGAFIESRGVSWAAGGDGDWRQFLTLPNILRELSPNLTGYSRGKAEFLTPPTALNLAFPISADEDALTQAKSLVTRMRRYLKHRYETDWKLVTILFGANDLCTGQCYDPNGTSPQAHADSLRLALDYLQRHIPRTLVNLVPVFDVTVSVRIKRSMVCRFLHVLFCSCFHRMSNPMDRFSKMAKLYQEYEERLISSGRYNWKPDFTVVIQPFSTGFNMPQDPRLRNKEVIDISYITHDCFHFSQKGHALVANMIWNNMLEPVGAKSRRPLSKVLEKFYCPTPENPYFFTTNNSIAYYKTGSQFGLFV